MLKSLNDLFVRADAALFQRPTIWKFPLVLVIILIVLCIIGFPFGFTVRLITKGLPNSVWELFECSFSGVMYVFMLAVAFRIFVSLCIFAVGLLEMLGFRY
jgi:hypothetical protein